MHFRSLTNNKIREVKLTFWVTFTLDLRLLRSVTVPVSDLLFDQPLKTESGVGALLLLRSLLTSLTSDTLPVRSSLEKSCELPLESVWELLLSTTGSGVEGGWVLGSEEGSLLLLSRSVIWSYGGPSLTSTYKTNSVRGVVHHTETQRHTRDTLETH